MNNHASSSISSSSSYTSKLFGIPTNSGAVVRALVSNKINIFAFRLASFLLTIDAVSSSDCECDIRAAFFFVMSWVQHSNSERKVKNVFVEFLISTMWLWEINIQLHIYAFSSCRSLSMLQESRVPRRLFCWISNWHFDNKLKNFSLSFFVSLSRHPLFSLLALLLEKCEQATQGYIPSASSSNSSASSPNGSTNNNENDSFSRDIQVSCAVDTFSRSAHQAHILLFAGICTVNRKGEASTLNQQSRARWSDDKSSTSASHSSARTREGSRAL